jgi:entry exclusion lipoprotein TrbK
MRILVIGLGGMMLLTGCGRYPAPWPAEEVCPANYAIDRMERSARSRLLLEECLRGAAAKEPGLADSSRLNQKEIMPIEEVVPAANAAI